MNLQLRLLRLLLLGQWLGAALVTMPHNLARAQVEPVPVPAGPEVGHPGNSGPVAPPVVIEAPALAPAPVAPVAPIVPVVLPSPVVVDAGPPPTARPTVAAPNYTVPNRSGSGDNFAPRPPAPQEFGLGATQPGTTQSPPSRPQLVLQERVTGCQAVLQPGQGVPVSVCDPVAGPQSQAAAPSGVVNGGDSGYGSSYGYRHRGYAPGQGGGMGIPSIPADIAAYLPQAMAAANPLNWLRFLNGKGGRFPLAIPAQITSAFGWRVHPISGAWKFHNGVDLGAPMGTPVMAVREGQVITATNLGGYGLTVVLSHGQQEWETLYAHLSEILVRPGQQVRQGDVIGRVGSTGYATGPHLHFEVLQSTPNGLVAIDPGPQMPFALAELIRALRTAQAQPVGKPQPQPNTQS